MEIFSNEEIILEGFRGIFKENKGHFNITINRMDQSRHLAYLLIHCNEIFTIIKTGKMLWDAPYNAQA